MSRITRFAVPGVALFAGLVCSTSSLKAALTVHEWGTFTSVHASDGRVLSGLEREEERLPNFVKSHAGFAPADKGWSRPVRNVTIKMETPVLYFYADTETPVRVDVGFNGGSIGQWYPERSGGETVAPPGPRVAVTDFAKGFEGSVRWQATVLAKGDPATVTAPKEWETPQWPRARVAGANRVRTADGSVEGFLFYRGMGNFGLPVKIFTNEAGRLTVENTGREVIPYLLVYRMESGVPGSRELRDLAPGERREVPVLTAALMGIHGELVAAGLTGEEAKAMLATWRESYFERDGLRVFWIMPRGFTDEILPLSISPAPEKLERVLVGRSEVLTPAFERELVAEFKQDGGRRRVNDRYFLAYAERARQLGVVMPAKTP